MNIRHAYIAFLECEVRGSWEELMKDQVLQSHSTYGWTFYRAMGESGCEVLLFDQMNCVEDSFSDMMLL